MGNTRSSLPGQLAAHSLCLPSHALAPAFPHTPLCRLCPPPPLCFSHTQALYDGQLVDAHFTRSFYKHVLGQPLTYGDIEAVDPEFYRTLR